MMLICVSHTVKCFPVVFAQLQPLGCAESDVSNWKLGPVSSVKRVMQRVNGVNRPVLAFIAPGLVLI